jgi:hypothetical protein
MGEKEGDVGATLAVALVGKGIEQGLGEKEGDVGALRLPPWRRGWEKKGQPSHHPTKPTD